MSMEKKHSMENKYSMENKNSMEEEQSNEAPQREEKKGLFARLKRGLAKTRESIVRGIDSVFSGFSMRRPRYWIGSRLRSRSSISKPRRSANSF